MQQWNKGLRLNRAAMSEEGEDIGQDHQEDSCVGDHEAKSSACSQDSKNE
jgi:hypothetical protein